MPPLMASVSAVEVSSVPFAATRPMTRGTDADVLVVIEAAPRAAS
jgi:hypothetical protein